MGTELLTAFKQPKTIHSFIRFFAIKTANKMKKIQSQFCPNYDVLLGRTPHKIKLAGFVFAFICTKVFHRSRFGTLTSRWWVIYLASSVSWQPKITWCCHRGGPEGLGAWGARGAPRASVVPDQYHQHSQEVSLPRHQMLISTIRGLFP